MARGSRPPRPLDAAALERLALRYVERFQTTRGRLADYLTRKIRERGWEGPAAEPMALAARMADLGYVDDRAWAEAKAAAMGRRGLGARRVAGALRLARVAEDDADGVAPAISARAVDSALALARRRRIGPFADVPADRETREKHIAVLVRGGHDFALARRIASMAPGADTADLDDR